MDIGTGVSERVILAGNVATPLEGRPGNDEHSVCVPSGDLLPNGCRIEYSTQWMVNDPAAANIVPFFTRFYTFKNGQSPSGYITPASGTLGEDNVSYP